MLKPTVDSIMKPFSKMVGKLESLVDAHNTQITACDNKITTVYDKCEAKVESLRAKTEVHTNLLHDQKAASVSERIKAENAINMIKKLTGEVSE